MVSYCGFDLYPPNEKWGIAFFFQVMFEIFFEEMSVEGFAYILIGLYVLLYLSYSP